MADHDLVLVTGAGGVGRLVTERLRAQNAPVRVLTRRENDRAAEVRARLLAGLIDAGPRRSP